MKKNEYSPVAGGSKIGPLRLIKNKYSPAAKKLQWLKSEAYPWVEKVKQICDVHDEPWQVRSNLEGCTPRPWNCRNFHERRTLWIFIYMLLYFYSKICFPDLPLRRLIHTGWQPPKNNKKYSPLPVTPAMAIGNRQWRMPMATANGGCTGTLWILILILL